MKYLKIENNCAFFIEKKSEPDNWLPIDKIEKENLIDLLDFAINEEDFEMDDFIIENIQNKAHQIIYKHIFEKLETVIENREKFKEEANATYKEALEKY